VGWESRVYETKPFGSRWGKVKKRSQFGINHFIINSLPPLRGHGSIVNAGEVQSCDMRIFGAALASAWFAERSHLGTDAENYETKPISH
jgi:hypothetical protein